jgi:hypothetical protein
MQLKLSDISPGDIIEHESWGCNHGGLQERLTRRKGKVIQVTDKVITLQGKNYPETLLVNDLLSGRAKILKVKMRGEDDMARVRKDKEKIMAKARPMLAEGLSIKKTAKELDVPTTTLFQWIKKEEEQQTLPPEPDQAANQEPERESQEPATEIIPVIMPLENDFTVDDEEPIPYILAPDHHDVAEEIACLLDRKGQDYGTENIKKFGSYGVLVRVSDKVERLINLSRKEGQVNFESVEDSWKDIAGYAILALIELREGR